MYGLILKTMNKKIPNILANQRLVVSNFLDRNDGLIIGDTEEVLDIKNQFIIETYKFDINSLTKKTNLAYGSVSADTGDGYDDFHYYPFIEIKQKGSGLNDLFKKNNHLPCGFFCIHDWAPIGRRSFDFYDLYKSYTSKKNFVRSIKISSQSICIFPLSNNLKKNPFSSLMINFDNYDLNLIKLGKNKQKIIESIKNFSKKSSLKLKIEGLYKFDDNKKMKLNLLKSASFKYMYDLSNIKDFVKNLENKGAKLELLNLNLKPLESVNDKDIKIFEKELNKIKKQKNKKKGHGDVIKCEVENGIYDVYNCPIRGEDEIYEGKTYPQYSSNVLVIKKGIKSFLGK